MHSGTGWSQASGSLPPYNRHRLAVRSNGSFAWQPSMEAVRQQAFDGSEALG